MENKTLHELLLAVCFARGIMPHPASETDFSLISLPKTHPAQWNQAHASFQGPKTGDIPGGR